MTSAIEGPTGPIKGDRSLRLYSKKHRVYVLREFLLQTYGEYLSRGDVILDVAGGKGDLSWILLNIDEYQSVVVDPRRTINHIDKSVAYLRAHPDECRKRAVPNVSTYQPIAALMPHLHAKQYVLQTPPHLRIFVDDELVQAVKVTIDGELDAWSEYWHKATERTVGFVSPTGRNDFSLDAGESTDDTIVDAGTAWDTIHRARLVVGFHPDQATDACLALARLLRVPVCIVPCCVFPSEFPHRRLVDETTGDVRPVERYVDLIPYLHQQYDLQTATLDFPGTTTARRIVLYTLPSSAILPSGNSNSE